MPSRSLWEPTWQTVASLWKVVGELCGLEARESLLPRLPLCFRQSTESGVRVAHPSAFLDLNGACC